MVKNVMRIRFCIFAFVYTNFKLVQSPLIVDGFHSNIFSSSGDRNEQIKGRNSGFLQAQFLHVKMGHLTVASVFEVSTYFSFIKKTT